MINIFAALATGGAAAAGQYIAHYAKESGKQLLLMLLFSPRL